MSSAIFDTGIANRRILITGAAGFIGSNLIRELVLRGAEVHAFVRASTNLWRLNAVAHNIQLHQADITDHDGVVACASSIRPDYVFHLAVQGVNPPQRVQAQMLKTGVIGTFNLLEALASVPFRRIIHVGGSTEYGRKKVAMAEHDVLEPVSFFGAVKAASTLLVGQFARANPGKSVVILRPFSVYGYWESSHRLIPTVILATLQQREIALTAPGIRHDFIFVEDVVKACVQALQVEIASGEIINLGTGQQFSNEEVVDIIRDVTGHAITVRPGAYTTNPWDTSFWVADCQKARRLLGWEARHSLRAGLEKTVSWFQRNLNSYA